jgi:DNA-binding CsgD family transcriptional regulator
MLAERVVAYDAAIRSSDEILRLRAYALRAAVAVAPATVAAFLRVSRRGTIEDAVTLQTAYGSFARAWERHLANARELDPVAPARVAGSSATVLMLDDVIMLYIRSAGVVVAAIVLARSIEREPFTRDDASALRRIQPLIEHAYLCAVEPRGDSARAALRRCGLTAREADVAELVGRGATNAEIARSLHVSEATVKTHLLRTFAKVGVRSRTQLAVLLGGEPVA